MKDVELAYIAGFLDGEGCITISKSGKRRYSLCVSFAQRKPETIRWVANLFRSKSSVYKYKNRKLYHFGMYGTEAKNLLVSVLPFLQEKKQQAGEAIRFQIHMEEAPKGTKLSDKTLQLRESIYQNLRKLKREDSMDC